MRLSGLRACLPSRMAAAGAVTITALGAVAAPGVVATPAFATTNINTPSGQTLL